MIKLIIKENKKKLQNLLTEAYVFSVDNPLVSNIRNALEPTIKLSKPTSFKVDIFLKDLIEYKDTSLSKKNGVPFFYYGNIIGQTFSLTPELKNYLDSNFQTEILNKKIPLEINFLLDSKSTDPAKALIEQNSDKTINLKINFYSSALRQHLKPYNTKNFDALIAHEITHFKQHIDPLVLKYGELAKKEKNYKKLKVLPLMNKGKVTVGLTGVGKKSDLKNVNISTPSEEYAVDQKEFLPNYDQLTKKLFIGLKDREKSNKFKNALSNINIDSSALAGQYVKKLAYDKYFLDEISGEDQLLYDYLRLNFLSREKEMPTKLIKTLTDKINNYRIVNNIKVKK